MADGEPAPDVGDPAAEPTDGEKSRRASQDSNPSAAVVSFTKVDEVEGSVVNSHTPSESTNPGEGHDGDPAAAEENVPAEGEVAEEAAPGEAATGGEASEALVEAAEEAADAAEEMAEDAAEAAANAEALAEAAADAPAEEAAAAADAAVEAAQEAEHIAGAAASAAVAAEAAVDAAADAALADGGNGEWRTKIRSNVQQRAAAANSEASAAADDAAASAEVRALHCQRAKSSLFSMRGRATREGETHPPAYSEMAYRDPPLPAPGIRQLAHPLPRSQAARNSAVAARESAAIKIQALNRGARGRERSYDQRVRKASEQRQIATVKLQSQARRKQACGPSALDNPNPNPTETGAQK